MLPAAPLTVAAADKLVTPSTVSYALNVPATMSANAAITIKVKSQQNRRNSFLPVLPMYCSIRSPIDLPSIFDAGVQGTEIGNSAEEDAAEDDPEKDRNPSKDSRLDRTGDRTGTGDG